MAKPLAIVSWVGNGVLTLLAIGLVIWVIILYGQLGDDEKHECNNPPPPSNCSKCNEAVSTQFSLKAKLSIKQLEFNKSCLMSMKDLGFIDTKISLDDLTKFEVNEADNCIKQKDFIDTDNSYNLSAVVKNTDTNKTMKLMVTFNAVASETNLFKTNELVCVDSIKNSSDLVVVEPYTTFKFNSINNEKVQEKLQGLLGKIEKIDFDCSDLNNASSLVVTANDNNIFKKAIISISYEIKASSLTPISSAVTGSTPVSSAATTGSTPISSAATDSTPVSSAAATDSTPVSSAAATGSTPISSAATDSTPVSSAAATGSTPVSSAATTGSTPISSAATTGSTPISSAATTGSTPISSAATDSTPVSSAAATGSTPVSSAATTGSTPISSAATTGSTSIDSESNTSKFLNYIGSFFSSKA